ncbi:hypothetical protein D9M69_663690 [compost metagenome]
MALELQQPGFARAGQEGLVASLVGQEERHVHARTAVGVDAVGVEVGAVDEVVQQRGLLDVALLHGGDAGEFAFGLLQQPLEREPRHVDTPGRWGVVHGMVVGHGLVVERARANLERVAQ